MAQNDPIALAVGTARRDLEARYSYIAGDRGCAAVHVCSHSARSTSAQVLGSGVCGALL